MRLYVFQKFIQKSRFEIHKIAKNICLNYPNTEKITLKYKLTK